MKSDKTDPRTGSGKDVVRRSFEKETDEAQHDANRERAGDKGRRSLMGVPVDPNSPTTKGNFPPGLPAEDAVDPGRATPGAAPVDNRSGSPRQTKPRK